MVTQPSDDPTRAAHGAPLDELVVLTAAGSATDFAQLYARLSPRAFSLILAIVVERDVAERTLVQVFLEVWDAAPMFDPAIDDPAEWVLLIARRRAVDSVRDRRPPPTFTEILRRIRSATTG